jgi:RTA1 like protein
VRLLLPSLHDASIDPARYTPNFALGVLGVALFTIALFLHLYLLFRHRTWYFSTVVVGTVMEIIGYIFRILASKINPYAVSYFVAQYFCIVVAPVFYSAAIYTILTVMINRVGREYSPLPPKVILWIFIVSDVVATVIQITGAALVGSAYSNGKDPNTPNNILLAGLAFQLFTFAIFILYFVLFLARSRKVVSRSFKIFSAAVMVATLAVYLRTCIRLAETAEGLLKFLSTHEVIFGCLEFLPIILAVYIFVYWHPGRWLGSKKEEGRAFKGRPEVSEVPK